MKKLMIAASAALCATVGLCVESANIVGYKNITTSATAYSGGPTFTIIGQAGTYKLSDFTAEGMAIDSDEIQFLSSDSAETYLEATYAGTSYPEAYRGWWDFNDVGGTALDDEEFANGTAFLVYNGSGNDIVFQYSGQVPTGSALTITIPAGTTAPFVCNPLPVDLTLGQITAEGMAIDSDEFQFLDDSSAETYIEATYAGTSYPAAYRGWWDFNDVGGTPLNDEVLLSGAAMLGYIGSGNEVVIQFPDPLASN